MKGSTRNIIRAQIYQLVRNRNLRAILLAMLAVSVFFGAAGKIDASPDDTACKCFVEMLSMTAGITQFAIAIITGIVCADDFNDKTTNHELTSGRLRSEVYIGRAIVALTLSVMTALLMMLLFTLTVFLGYTRGHELTTAAIVQRLLLLIPVFIRLSCFYVLVSFIVKKPIAVFGICYGLIMILGELNSMGGGEKARLLTGTGSFSIVYRFEEWHTYGLNTDVYFVYEPFVKSGTAVMLTAISLIMGAAYLILGYSYFHRDDIK